MCMWLCVCSILRGLRSDYVWKGLLLLFMVEFAISAQESNTWSVCKHLPLYTVSQREERGRHVWPMAPQAQKRSGFSCKDDTMTCAYHV